MTPPTPGHRAWADRTRGRLDSVIDGGRWRAPREFDAFGPQGTLNQESVVSFASNDYLGLSMHPTVIAAAHAALDRWGTGAGASRLVTGSRPVHSQLEEELAAWKGTEAAICFPTGFAANLGTISVLGDSGVRILSDELNHASIIEGCRISRSDVTIYRHADVNHLSDLLEAQGRTTTPTMVITDTVFSMDGDIAPVEEIADLCRRHGAILMLDEAHAVLGPHLTATLTDDSDLMLIRMGTLSKALGAMGGFVAASRDMVDLLVNLARSYIFTTALTPADAAAALAALRIVRSAEGDALMSRLSALVARVAGPEHPSPIVPVILGSEAKAIAASSELLSEGLWVPAIRPPTVPPGTSRLRITLSAAHTDAQVDHLVATIDHLVGALATRQRI
ncbi:MAG TPA: aminotransferase class I/II-fold pyridoxal phosphate-dependent enzyme [Acidimicrobiales bacterium]